jgi:hypothetical protein
MNKHDVKTVTPNAKVWIESNAKTKQCADLCSFVENLASHDLINAFCSATAYFCPHKDFCAQLRHGNKCDTCEYVLEKMRYIRGNYNLTLGQNLRV